MQMYKIMLGLFLGLCTHTRILFFDLEQVGTLKELEFFGESALLGGTNDLTRNATITVESDYVQVLGKRKHALFYGLLLHTASTSSTSSTASTCTASTASVYSRQTCSLPSVFHINTMFAVLSRLRFQSLVEEGVITKDVTSTLAAENAKRMKSNSIVSRSSFVLPVPPPPPSKQMEQKEQ